VNHINKLDCEGGKTMAVTIFTWFLIVLMVLLAIASVKFIISSCYQVYKKFHTISEKKRGPLNKSIQV
ncbi:MAG: hypothetical protein ACYDEX_25475, partial [Mobilitalea sp.]